MVSYENDFATLVKDDIRRSLEQEVAAEIENATKYIKERLQQRVGEISLQLLNLYSVERSGNTLRIEVKIGGEK